MDALDDVDQLIKRYQLALDEFMKGNPENVAKMNDSPLATSSAPCLPSK
jgi:hypothetical protein